MLVHFLKLVTAYKFMSSKLSLFVQRDGDISREMAAGWLARCIAVQYCFTSIVENGVRDSRNIATHGASWFSVLSRSKGSQDSKTRCRTPVAAHKIGKELSL